MPSIPALDFQGSPVRRRGALLNLSDLWRAHGCPAACRPTDWLARNETRLADDAGPDDGDLLAEVHSDARGVWAHWRWAPDYAWRLSPGAHLWCLGIAGATHRRGETPTPKPGNTPPDALGPLLGRIERRLDALERHAADLMLLQLSLPDLLMGQRRPFGETSRRHITATLAAEPFGGRCPCCGTEPVLDAAGRPLPGAEFDHVYHRGLNRAEHGWLICKDCHADLTKGGYLARFDSLPRFRALQDAVDAHRRRTLPRPRPRAR